MMNRREFAGLAAGAAATATMASRASAQTQLGQPHPPIVPENDPAIIVEHVRLARPDGEVSAYAAYPATTLRTTPGVVISMHIWGVDAQIRDTARRYAKAGFMCIAPDLYSRMNAPSGDGSNDVGTYRPFAAKLDRTQYAGDFRAAAGHLHERAPEAKVGITGFCMGGHIALIQAIDNAEIFTAVAPFYGAVKDIDPTAIHIPVCGSYGENDQSIPAADVRAWAAKLRVQNDVHIYPGAGHAFFDDTRKSYVASAADDAWQRTITFFQQQLRIQP